MPNIFRIASKLTSLPLLDFIVPGANKVPKKEILVGYLASQRLAQQSVREVGTMMREGWTEIQAAKMVETFLRDSGVSAFFHHPFAWFGDRTRFDGIKSYSEYSPKKRVLLPGEIFILDVAPIFHGYISDIGYTSSLGGNEDLHRAKHFLNALRTEIPSLFSVQTQGSELWKQIDHKIRDAGYLNIHKKYPFSVLGHRVHRTNELFPQLKVLNFGWQSYWSLLSRGLFGQLFNEQFEGDMTGLWAIEPHIGAKHFGAKFEEILVVTPDGAHWLEEKPQFAKEFL